MPNSLQARMTRNAISPRLAIRTFSNIDSGGRPAQLLRVADAAPALHSRMRGTGLTDAEENLTELNRFAVLHEKFRNNAGGLGFDFVHDLHRFDDTDNGVFVDLSADVNKWRRVR